VERGQKDARGRPLSSMDFCLNPAHTSAGSSGSGFPRARGSLARGSIRASGGLAPRESAKELENALVFPRGVPSG
jgi:hypothetical protein